MSPRRTRSAQGQWMFRRDVINEQQHPGAQLFNRGHGLRELANCTGQLLELNPIGHLDQCVARRKGAIQSSVPTFTCLRYSPAGVCAKQAKRLRCNLQNARAVQLRIRRSQRAGIRLVALKSRDPH